MRPKLISSILCPYAQRCAIMLKHKRIEHDLEYINPSSPPAGFEAISPLRKVPALVIDGHAFFGSSVINEFLDETFPHPLHPADPLRKAHHRSWMEFGSECMGDLAKLMLEKSEPAVRDACAALLGKFDRLEAALGDGPYFDGAAFSLVDAAYGPLFQRLDYLRARLPAVIDDQRHPHIAAWRTRLLAHEALRESTPPNLRTRFFEFAFARGGYIAGLPWSPLG